MSALKTPTEFLGYLVNLSGVKSAVLISRDGFMIEYSSKKDIDLYTLGSIASTGFGASQVMGSGISLGELHQAVMEYNEGKILMISCGDDAILVIITEKNAILGSIWYEMKKANNELVGIIKWEHCEW